MQSNYDLGVFIKAFTPVTDIKESLRSCSNKQCLKHLVDVWDKSILFCARCGHKIVNVSKIKKGTKLSHWSITEDMDGDLLHFIPGDNAKNNRELSNGKEYIVHFYRSNIRTKSFEVDITELNDYVLLDNINVSKEIDIFKQEMSKAIKILESNYEFLEYHFGVMHTIS